MVLVLHRVTPPITLVLIPVMDPDIKGILSQRSNGSTINLSVDPGGNNVSISVATQEPVIINGVNHHLG